MRVLSEARCGGFDRAAGVRVPVTSGVAIGSKVIEGAILIESRVELARMSCNKKEVADQLCSCIGTRRRGTLTLCQDHKNVHVR